MPEPVTPFRFAHALRGLSDEQLARFCHDLAFELAARDLVDWRAVSECAWQLVDRAELRRRRAAPDALRLLLPSSSKSQGETRRRGAQPPRPPTMHDVTQAAGRRSTTA